MKKNAILVSIFASIILGGASAWAVTSIKKQESNALFGSTITPESYLETPANPSTQNILPDFTQAAEKGVNSVVNIVVTKRVSTRGSYGMGESDIYEFFYGRPQGQRKQVPQYQEQKGGGSGVIISSDGYIISNNHVVEGANEIRVTTHSGDMYTAKVIGTDPATDLALLKIEAKNLPVLAFGNSDNLKLGEWVLAVGNPFGLTSTVTQGIVSAKGRAVGVSQNSRLEIESFIQTDAVVNQGNSGGALITLDGSLVGINAMLYSPTGTYAGYSFAIPSSIVKKVVSDLREFGVVQRALLGIQMAEISAEWLEKFGTETGVTERGGIYVGEATEGGAAHAAGIKKGDIITAIDNIKMNTTSAIQEYISKRRPNDKVKISIKRDGTVKHFDVTLRNKAGNTDVVTKKTYDLALELGAQLRDITEKQKSDLNIGYGVQVANLNPDGLLARSRVKVGFIITAINDIPITKVSEIEAMNIESVEMIEGIYPDGSRVIYSTMKQ